MSLFGTLGRKGRRKASMSQHEFGLSREQSDETTAFKSTPNLHKIELGTAHEVLCSPQSLLSPTEIYDYEKNPRSKFKFFQGHAPSHSSVGTATGSTSSLSSTSLSAVSQDSRHGSEPTNQKSSTFPSFRGFVSKFTLVSGISRSKSVRRKAFTSSNHQRQNDQSPVDHHEEVISEEYAGSSCVATCPRSYATHRSVSIKSSHSAPNMETEVDRLRQKSLNVNDQFLEKCNSEPGVESSSTTSLSSACTNPSVSENESYVSINSQCQSSAVTHELETREEESESINSQQEYEDASMKRMKLMLQAAKKFNMDPKKGIDFLVLNGLLEKTPESIAQFLKHGEQLSKSMIGNYLGEHHEFNLDILDAFVDLHDFTDVLLVEALRQFLWSFRLPGEAQKIDRMMECFAKKYTQCNPTLFTNSDTCYLLSFAIIMLNTSLHNPNVKEKPSLEQFIQMNRDIDDGQPLDRKFITSLYNSIRTEPFQIPPEDGDDLMLTFFNPAIEGRLWKQGGRYKTWKQRWFILSNNCLYYFLLTTDKHPRGIIPLENIEVRRSVEIGKEFCFTLYKKSSDPKVTEYIKSCKASDGKLTAGKHVRYHLATKTKEDRDRWIAAISQNSSFHNFYTILAAKKNKMEASERGTLRRNRSVRPPVTIKLNSVASPGTVRKSQIGSPLTRLDSTMAKSMPHILNSDLRQIGKDPHQYFTTASTSNLDYRSDEATHGSDSGGSSQISLEKTQSPDSKRRISESALSITTSYGAFSLPRSKSRKNHLNAPIRKFSLPPDSKSSRLTSKIDYLTSPGIRISVEDTDKPVPQSSEPTTVVIISNGTDTTNLDIQVRNNTSKSLESSDYLSVIGKEEEESKNFLPINIIPSIEVHPNSGNFISALKQFANVMEHLSLNSEEEWADEAEMSLEELQTTGLTRQCLRSSVKSKRSRYRQKPRKHHLPEEPVINNSQTTVINMNNLESTTIHGNQSIDASNNQISQIPSSVHEVWISNTKCPLSESVEGGNTKSFPYDSEV